VGGMNQKRYRFEINGKIMDTVSTKTRAGAMRWVLLKYLRKHNIIPSKNKEIILKIKFLGEAKRDDYHY
jgi:hypothetical protein